MGAICSSCQEAFDSILNSPNISRVPEIVKLRAETKLVEEADRFAGVLVKDAASTASIIKYMLVKVGEYCP
jgi:hypothetical protein